MMCCPSNIKVIENKNDTVSRSRRVDKLCKTLQAMELANTMSQRFVKPPYFISRATSIDSDWCRLSTASVLSNKADKSPSNQF